jgi:hypothetical protein
MSGVYRLVTCKTSFKGVKAKGATQRGTNEGEAEREQTVVHYDVVS